MDRTVREWKMLSVYTNINYSWSLLKWSSNYLVQEQIVQIWKMQTSHT